MDKPLNYQKHKRFMNQNHGAHIRDFRQRFFISLILTIPILLLSETIQAWFQFTIVILFQKEILFFLSAVIYFYGGYPFLKGVYKEITKKQPGMMTLIGTAISVAFIYSSGSIFILGGKTFFWELATLIDVMLLGHWIEAKSVLGASRALEELVKIMPTDAHLIKDSDITDVPVSDLRPGNVVMVRPGEKIPADGTVIEGESYINEAFLTGESKPVHKKEGDIVIAGSINKEGSLQVKIEKTGEKTYLAQVIDLVKKAQESKSRTQDLANRAAALLFYVALSAGVITFLVWTFVESPDFALERSVTVMVIACPHALGLAIPLVVAISTSLTAKSGILIRERSAFERARNVDAIVFDKTGTLTVGKFGVSDVVSLLPEEKLLKITGGIEVNSEHIIAEAIVEYIAEKNIEIYEAENFSAIPGKGATGTVNGKTVYVGSPALMEELGVDMTQEGIQKLKSKGKTTVYTVVDSKLAGAFALSDSIKEESYTAVKSLQDMGVSVYMLTGDSEEVAQWVAKELGITNYFAEVLPDEKREKIKVLKDAGLVFMVGDGINDAPALVTADVGIAIGAGTDVAIESADIILVKNDPRDIFELVDFSKKTYSKMVQNLWWAAGYNIVAIPLAAGVLSGMGIVISPAIGALVMSLSTVIVAVNSQTLRKYES
jgi:Cu2+-exporting ATPase